MIGYIIAIVISSVALIMVVRNIINGLNSRNWLTTEGKITDSGIDAQQSMDDEGNTRTTYGVSLAYTYNVSGQEIQGTRRSFSDVRTNSRRRAEQILARYPQGGSVTVYHHPDDPSVAVLETGVHWFTYAALILILGFLVFGILGALGFIGK
ncbi:MAG: DUF3592 domain-containing protein [Anaerolineales bacterium]|nr:DUF3592 domain-containing protein [Anaerolineales bacterium]